MVLDDDAHGLFLADNEAWHSIPSGDADISSQLPLPSSPHYQNSGYQREKLEERDKAGDNSDFVAETPSFGTLAVPFVVVGFGFLLSLFVAFNFSDGRRLRGGILFAAGLLLAAIGGWPWGWLL